MHPTLTATGLDAQTWLAQQYQQLALLRLIGESIAWVSMHDVGKNPPLTPVESLLAV